MSQIIEYMLNMSTATTRVIVEEPPLPIPIPPPRLNLPPPPDCSINMSGSSPPHTPPMRQWPSASPPLLRRPPQLSTSITITPESESEEVLIAKMRWLETIACKAVMTEEERRTKLKEVTERFRNTLKMKEFFRRMGSSSKQMEEDDLYN